MVSQDGEWSFNVVGPSSSDGRDGDLVIRSSTSSVVRVGNFSADGGGLTVGNNALTANLPASFTCNVTVAGTVSVGAVGGGSGNALTYLSGTAGNDDSTLCHLWYSSNQSVGPLLTLDAIGTLTARGDLHVYSDVRVKADLQPIRDALRRVQDLHGYTFVRVDAAVPSDRRYTGLVAQDVMRAMPEAVSGDGTLSVAYGALTGLIVEAIKELADRMDKLEAELRGPPPRA